jgi:hypothetical protein
MPIDLSDAELATAAQACRAMAYQEGERAGRMENPTTRGPIEAASRRYAALAKKLEAARVPQKGPGWSPFCRRRVARSCMPRRTPGLAPEWLLRHSRATATKNGYCLRRVDSSRS